jgi:hypothetical protein
MFQEDCVKASTDTCRPACGYKPRKAFILAALAALLACATSARAVLLYSTSQRNNWAPSGSLWNSGWQYEGYWGSFNGTPISPRHFITAGHVGGSVGQTFSFRGQNYVAKAMYDDPNSDLRIWQVDRNMPYWSPIYRGAAEQGRQIVLYGRGVQRGGDVYAAGQKKGWYWGAYDGKLSWGTNVVSATQNSGAGIGALLRTTFDKNVSHDEGALSGYDSGAGAFINDNGTWKLAGVNFAAGGPYALAPYTPTFNASLFDQGGLYVGNTRTYIPDAYNDVPGYSFITRISANLPWIDSVLRQGGVTSYSTAATPMNTVPEPATGLLLVIASVLMRRNKSRQNPPRPFL